MASATCHFCRQTLENSDDLVTPGPDFGPAHRPCFIAWDHEQEAREVEFARRHLVPDPAAFAAAIADDTRPASRPADRRDLAVDGHSAGIPLALPGRSQRGAPACPATLGVAPDTDTAVAA